MKTIDELRIGIDDIDNDLLVLLRKRKKLVTIVARYKSDHHMKIRDSTRERQLLSKLSKKARLNGLDQKFVTDLYDIILKNSRAEQKNTLIRNKTVKNKR
jgi:chorismate mutase